MSDENRIKRRRALQVIAAGVGAGVALPILDNKAFAQHAHASAAGAATATQTETPPRFFNAQEMAIIAAVSEQIIPSGDHSPGALAAGVPAFIDTMVNESPLETKTLWRQGLSRIEAMTREKFLVGFAEARSDQQISILKTISRNERNPKRTEERFERVSVCSNDGDVSQIFLQRQRIVFILQKND